MSRWIVLFAAGLTAVLGCRQAVDAPATLASSEKQPEAHPVARDGKVETEAEQSEMHRGRDYLPLSVGRVMHYNVMWSPPLGTPRSATATGEVQAEVEIGDKHYFKQVTKISGIPFAPTAVAYYRPTPQGIYQILEGDEGKPEWTYLPNVIEVGDIWTASTSQGELEFEALGFEDVTTPCGDYRHCLKLSLTIKATLGTATEEQWLAPGVGVVKQTDKNALFSSTTLLEEVSLTGDDQP